MDLSETDMLLLRIAFERDSTYTRDQREECYINAHTSKVIWVSDELGDPDEEFSKYESDPAWIQVPVTHSAEWQQVFRTYLNEIGMDHHYSTSIPLTLRTIGDESVSSAWADRKYEYALEKAGQWAEEFVREKAA